MRRQLVASDPGELQAHDHVLWCGEGSRPLHELAVAVFRSAVRRRERMLFVAEQPRLDWLAALEDLDQLLATGALHVVPVRDIYLGSSDVQEQRARFEGEVAEALDHGYSGLRVVADNSRLLGTTEREFADWLAWEAVADEMQATRPLSGVCYFDRLRVPAARLVDLAALHPVRGDRSVQATFQVFSELDDHTLRLVGEIDGTAAHQIERVVGAAVSATGRALDISSLGFIDHRALLSLEAIARSGTKVQLRGASDFVHRLWELLDVPKPALEIG
jgi:ABC-type transporter Mla MlaB component